MMCGSVIASEYGRIVDDAGSIADDDLSERAGEPSSGAVAGTMRGIVGAVYHSTL